MQSIGGVRRPQELVAFLGAYAGAYGTELAEPRVAFA